MSDLTITNHISIMLLAANTEAGREWMAEHLPSDAQTWGGAVVVEPRYISDIVHGAINDGLEVS